MIPSCLNDIVGFRKESLELPSKFGIYIESLPGLNMSDITAMADSDYPNTKAFLADKIDFSITNFISDIQGWILPKFRIGAMLDRFIAGKTQKGNITYKTGSANARGIKLIRVQDNNYGLIVIGEIKVMLNNTATFTLTISDTNGQSKDYEFNSEAGIFSVIQADFNSDASEVLITISPTSGGESPEDSLPANFKLYSGCGTCSSVSRTGFIAHGWNGVKQDTCTYGIVADITYQCDPGQIACLFRNNTTFQNGLRYRVGMDLMDEILGTDRANSKTIHNREQKQTYRDQWQLEMEKCLEILRETSNQMLAKPRTKCITCNQSRYYER